MQDPSMDAANLRDRTRPEAASGIDGPDVKRFVLGDMAETVEILSDIVSPVIDLADIAAYRNDIISTEESQDDLGNVIELPPESDTL